MADPFTWVLIASAGLQAAGSIAEGNAEYSQGMYESNIAKENARRARESAGQIRLAGQAAEEAKRREVRRSLGRSAAAISEAGIGGPGYGSAAAALKQAATEGEYDAAVTGYGYSDEAYKTELEGLNYDAEALAAKRRARSARTAGFVGAASAALGGFTSYSGMRAQRASFKVPTRGTGGPKKRSWSGPR